MTVSITIGSVCTSSQIMKLISGLRITALVAISLMLSYTLDLCLIGFCLLQFRTDHSVCVRVSLSPVKDEYQAMSSVLCYFITNVDIDCSGCTIT